MKWWTRRAGRCSRISMGRMMALLYHSAVVVGDEIVLIYNAIDICLVLS